MDPWKLGVDCKIPGGAWAGLGKGQRELQGNRFAVEDRGLSKGLGSKALEN